jgi:hypothetical protein
MSDISTLLLNRIRESLEKLSNDGVGFINFEDSQGIQYQIDGKWYYISIKELSRYLEVKE